MTRNTIDQMVSGGIGDDDSGGDDDDDEGMIRLECLADCKVMKTLFVLPGRGRGYPGNVRYVQYDPFLVQWLSKF